MSSLSKTIADMVTIPENDNKRDYRAEVTRSIVNDLQNSMASTTAREWSQ